MSPIYGDCTTPALACISIAHIRSRVALDVRLFVVSSRDVTLLLKSIGVGNVEVVATAPPNETTVGVWLDSPDSTTYAVRADAAVGSTSVFTLIPEGKRIAWDAPWDSCTTGRERLQRALFETVPIHDAIRTRVRTARIFGPEIASYVFVQSGGVAALDPRRIVDIESDGSTRFVSSLTPARNVSQCILQGANRESSENATLVEAVRTSGVKKARNKTSATPCVCLFSCSRHALGENELDSFAIARPNWKIACPLCDWKLWVGVAPFYQRIAPLDTANSILLFIPYALVAAGLRAFMPSESRQTVTIVETLDDGMSSLLHAQYDAVLVADESTRVHARWRELVSIIPSCAFANHILLYSI